MTQESPHRPKSEYEKHQPSEENGLIEDLEPGETEPEYLLEQQEQETTFQLDFGYFFNQTQLFDWTEDNYDRQ